MATSTVHGVLSSDEIGQYIALSKTSASEDIWGTAGTITAIGWDTEDHKDSNFTHDNSTNNSRVTVTDAGRYSITCVVNTTNTGASNRTFYGLYPRLNGTTSEKAGKRITYQRFANTPVALHYASELEMSASDYLEMVADIIFEDVSGTPTSDTVNGECELIIRRIG